MKLRTLLKATSGAALTLAAPHLALAKTRPLRFVPQADLAVPEPEEIPQSEDVGDSARPAW